VKKKNKQYISKTKRKKMELSALAFTGIVLFIIFAVAGLTILFVWLGQGQYLGAGPSADSGTATHTSAPPVSQQARSLSVVSIRDPVSSARGVKVQFLPPLDTKGVQAYDVRLLINGAVVASKNLLASGALDINIFPDAQQSSDAPLAVDVLTLGIGSIILGTSPSVVPLSDAGTEGLECTLSAQCDGSTICNGTTGLCEPPAIEGAACTDAFDCEGGLVCTGSLCTPTTLPQEESGTIGPEIVGYPNTLNLPVTFATPFTSAPTSVDLKADTIDAFNSELTVKSITKTGFSLDVTPPAPRTVVTPNILGSVALAGLTLLPGEIKGMFALYYLQTDGNIRMAITRDYQSLTFDTPITSVGGSPSLMLLLGPNRGFLAQKFNTTNDLSGTLLFYLKKDTAAATLAYGRGYVIDNMSGVGQNIYDPTGRTVELKRANVPSNSAHVSVDVSIMSGGSAWSPAAFNIVYVYGKQILTTAAGSSVTMLAFGRDPAGGGSGTGEMEVLSIGAGEQILLSQGVDLLSAHRCVVAARSTEPEKIYLHHWDSNSIQYPATGGHTGMVTLANTPDAAKTMLCCAIDDKHIAVATLQPQGTAAALIDVSFIDVVASIPTVVYMETIDTGVAWEYMATLRCCANIKEGHVLVGYETRNSATPYKYGLRAVSVTWDGANTATRQILNVLDEHTTSVPMFTVAGKGMALAAAYSDGTMSGFKRLSDANGVVVEWRAF
jgi:hypothetical protein